MSKLTYSFQFYIPYFEGSAYILKGNATIDLGDPTSVTLENAAGKSLRGIQDFKIVLDGKKTALLVQDGPTVVLEYDGPLGGTGVGTEGSGVVSWFVGPPEGPI